MSKKANVGTNTVTGWPCFKSGEPITHWIRIGKERYPFTDSQWQRRQQRLTGEDKR